MTGLEIFAGLGITHATFDQFSATEWNASKTSLVETDYKDNYLPYAPKYTFNAGVQYRSPKGLFLRTDLLGTDRYYGDIANKSRQDAYQTINLRVGYESDTFDIYLWAKNLFDKQYLTYVGPFNTNSDVGLDGPPRTVGIDFVFRF